MPVRDDDNQLTFRVIRRWFAPLFLVLLGLVLYFTNGIGDEPIAAPPTVEAGE